ncbi:ATP synthase mitochondrial F1 complex assembly factor 1 isoform X6 [Oncorhynchus mykiss]|uniref:ATP synthase mitochondrial F1 complex assembly factor 1 isoform X6 n=2 Tax=Oncorhynchus TaxID=8016 RepID=UPI000B4F2B03|nr:ATP synthase mitochondrial F1 complex assembly factor 1 isoform X6 [Oncorhynchus mykiss]
MSFMCDDSEGGKMAAAMVQMSCLYRGMLAVRATGIRPLIPGLVPSQFRAFSVKKEKEPELEDNPYYNKYQEKIRKLRSAKPQEFNARLEKRNEIKREPLGHSKQSEFVNLMEQELEKRDNQADGSGRFTKDKTLGSILNLDLIQDKSGEEIAELWRQYYATKDTISAIIPAHVFEVIFNRAKCNPVTMGEHAPSQLILYHYSDLQKDKGVVLMTAEMDPKFMTVHLAQCLANQVQLFYGTQRQEIFRLVETFNHKPADFKHMAVIAELEQSGVNPALTSGN